MRGYEARFRVRSGGVECIATIRVIRRSGARAFLDGWTTAVVGPVAVGLRIEPAPTVDAESRRAWASIAYRSPEGLN